MNRTVKTARKLLVRTRLGFVLALVGVLLLSGSLEFPERAAAATNVSGTISTDTTWTLAGSPYVMTDNVYVAAGVTLTIEPGVVVQGNGETRLLTVDGSLSAVGTAGQPITFTSTADSGPGQWHGIRFDSPGGSSTLEYVDVRYGGDGGISKANGMVEVLAGAVTIEDSTFTASAVSGLRVAGGLAGMDASAVVRRSKFEGNGFVDDDRHGDGLNVYNARVVVENSAFWSNANDGIAFLLGNDYEPAPSEISGSSIWDNRRFGVYSSVEVGAEAFSPDGQVAGKPGNAVYDNGTFDLSADDKWIQLSVSRASSSVDWSGTYWGPVVSLPCALGSGRGHLSYAAPDPNTSSFNLTPVPRGPVSHTASYTGGYPNYSWCGNDFVVVDPPAYELPDLHFDAPPPTFGGLLLEQTLGCTPCHREDPQLGLSLDAGSGEGPLAHTKEPVNTASGSLTETATDLRLAGPGIPLAWSRSYNSRDTSSGALGPGWAHPFEAKITVVNPTTGELEYRAGSGQRTRFTKVSGGSSGSAAYRGKGFDGTLKRLSSNAYELVTRDQRKLSFDTAGNLTQIKPRFGPATTLAYTSGRLSSITDSAGRTITLTYSLADPDLIERVTLPDGRYVEYGYTSGRLTSVRDPRGKTWTLAYDANGLLTSIQDSLGHYELQNVLYDGQGRVTSEQNGTGDTIAYAYTTQAPYEVTTVSIPGRGDWVYKHRGLLLMHVVDPLGRMTSYTYDGMARKATETDGRGNTTRFEYDERGNLIKEVAPQPLAHTATRTFNASNDVLTEKDGRGNTTTYTYAGSANGDYQDGQLKTITDREGGLTTFKYWTSTSSPTPPATNVGLLKSVTNQRSKTTLYAYDSSGNLTKITSPLGLETTMGYDASGRLTSQRDPRGNIPDPPADYLTQWDYDAVDHVTQLTDARGNVTSYDYYDNELLWKVTRTDRDGTPRITAFEYDAANRLWKTTDPRTGVETRLYWPDGQVKFIQSPEGRKTSYEYDAAGQLTTLVEPNGNATGATPSDWTSTYAYDQAGNRTSEAHPDGGTSEIAYDALNRPFQWTDALDHITSVEYDANGNVTKHTNGLSDFRTFTYDKLDRLKTETDERGKTWTYSYHPTGELASETSPLGNKATYALDDDGRTSSMVEPRGNKPGGSPPDYTWTYAYDEAGNRTGITDPLGNQLAYSYDPVNNLTEVTDARGNATTYAYDVLNRLWKVTPPAAGASGTLHTEYAYDAAGNLATRTDPNGHETSWAHDLDGLPTSRTTEVGTWNTSYDANGNPTILEMPSGSSTPTVGDGTITYGYDRMSRLTSVDYSDTTPDVTRTYDLAGRLDTMTDGAGGTVAYTWDNADRLTDLARTGADAGLNGTFTYAYDDAGNITGRTYPDATAATAAFDDDGRLTSISSGGSTTGFAYDEAGNITTVTQPTANGHVATRSFDRAGRLTTVENAKAGTILSRFAWTLDPGGNPTKVQTTRGVADTYDAYEYDTRNRLTASCYGIAQAASDCAGAANKITYAYDKVSNRTQETRTGSVGNTGTIDFTYNAADQLTQTVQGGNAITYTYDANGNQASAGARTFTYDLADQLISTTNAGATTTYAYDGDGRRISSTVGGGGADLRYIWDPLAESGILELALERTPTASLVRRYLNGPLGSISVTNAAGTFAYHHDPLGTVTDLTDSSGAGQWQYDYETYGAERSATNVSGTAPENRLRFNSQYLDPETGLYHLRARQYDPTVGRFGALDPIESAFAAPYNAGYVYVNGRPTVLVDPAGTWPKVLDDAVDATVGAVEAVGNAAAGALDGATGGLSTAALNTVGIRPDENSFAYKAGRITGTVAAVGSGGGLAVKVAGRLAVKAAGRAVAASAGGAATNIGLEATRAAVNGQPYGLTDAARAAAIGAVGDGAGYLTARCIGRALTTFAPFAAKAGTPTRAWPSTADEMDDVLGVPGRRIPDGPMTPGRGKVVWEPNSKTKITFEQHPYHPNAPDWHRGPHWHLDTPGNKHQRYVPGDRIPGYDNP